ncbi:orotidine-5'-phosphate decarboxylase [Oceanobacillus senegalensis]|uniref:orotidine-5'-phosphate decarboxylase n=1 Tax=Oceanobacillus senegalensis TaxID=1936063 RepID=UPI000A313D9C|nr:orotidine-5'-phosphate decarboxylase [Oceanobacillus senegalensis]
MKNNPIYVALDFPSWNETEQFLMEHDLRGVPVKVGMELFYREGPRVIEKLKVHDHPIFLDLKLHDIPTTVMRAMRNLANLGVDIVNVHALGGSGMIQAAKEGLNSSDHPTKLIAVTILTSLEQETLNNELFIPGSVQDNAVHFAGFAKDNGADGVVCSVHEATAIKEACGSDFLTVTPGIRLDNSEHHDQKRVATPKFAKENGSDIVVIGRSITKAENPRKAYDTALKECSN